MLHLRQFLLSTIFLFGTLKGETEPQKNANSDLIPAILKYLQEHNSFYSYKTGSVLQSFFKDDKLEVTADIETSCDHPCLGGILRCDTVFRKGPDGVSWIVAGTVCAPQEPHFEEVKETYPAVQTELFEEKRKVLQSSNKSPAPCLGCPFDINTNANGVNKLVTAALRHVESERNAKHILLKVLRVQQQVVGGINYILLIEVAPTICHKDVDLPTCPLDMNKESFICEIDFFERPWLPNNSAITRNNCTISQRFKVEEPINTTKKPVHRDIDADFLSELESQIIPDQTKLSSSANDVLEEYSDIPQVIIQRRTTRGVKGQKETELTTNDNSSSSSSSSSSSLDNDDKKKKHKSAKNKKDDSDSSSSSSDEEDNSKHNKKKQKVKKQKNHKTNKNDSSDSSSSSSSEDKSQTGNENVSVKKRDIGNQPIVDKLIQIARKHIGTENINVVGSAKVILDRTHFKLDLLVDKHGTIDECSVYMTVNENVDASTVDKVVCGPDRVKRGIKGGIKPASKDDPEVKKFLGDGLLHLDSHSTHTNRYKVKEILDVTKQTVSGSLWRIKAVVVLSDCEKGKNVDVDSCGEHADPQKQICNFKVWSQPWLPNGRETNITCEIGEYSFRSKRGIDLNKEVSLDFDQNRDRVKREIVGGITQASKDDPEVKEFLGDGLLHLDSHSAHTNRYKVKEILDVSKQTVSGSLWRIKAVVVLSDCEKGKNVDLDSCGEHADPQKQICNFKVWSQPWLPNGRETNITCENGAYSFRSKRGIDLNKEVSLDFRQDRDRVKRLIPGGINQASKDDPQVKEFLGDGLLHLDSHSTHTNRYKVKEILDVSKQTVSGSLWRIKAVVVLSDCEKGKNVDLDSCGEHTDPQKQICNFKVWSQPWLPNGRETNITCENGDYSFRSKRGIDFNKEVSLDFDQDRDRVKRQIDGGINPASKDDPTVKEFLNDGLLHLDSHSTHANRYKVKEILDVSQQVVSGSIWRIKAVVVLSDCEKGKNVDLDSCGEHTDPQKQICNFKVWSQPWLPNGRETNITCENGAYSFRSKRGIDLNKEVSLDFDQDRDRVKRLIPGGINQASKDDPQVKEFLGDGLLHLDSHSTHTNRYKVKEILDVSKQTVSGSLWRIKAVVVLSDCEKGKNVDLDSCGEHTDPQKQICNFKVWSQPWLPNGRETNITCENGDYSFRSKRGIGFDEDMSLDFDEDSLNEIKFQNFINKYQKQYKKEVEYLYRLKVFKANLNKIRLLNKYEKGTAHYTVTKFSDLSPFEFSQHLGLRTDLQNENEIPYPEAKIPDIQLPTSFDWRQKNAVTEVKDQGSCGSCWAFSTTGNIEGQYAIKYEKLQEFSEQELVDCDKLDDGCSGGLMDNAYRTIEKLGGLESEGDYPYDAEDEQCHFNKSKVIVQLSGALNISTDETDMAKWLTQNGPISIAINANAMQFYAGGVSHPWKSLCNPQNLDHGVLIVGYGVHTYPMFNKTLPFWIVKNSWGKSWGEQGYYRVFRGDGTCGLNKTPSSAIVA